MNDMVLVAQHDGGRLTVPIVDIDGHRVVLDQDLAGESLSALRARLRKEGLKAAEIEARIAQIIADGQKTHAETDQIRAGTERQRLDAQIATVKAALIAERAMRADSTAEFLQLINAMQDR